jgi:hypothetical protein
MNGRVYPIRTTRKYWSIPLFCYHICNENCNILIVSNNSNQYVLIDNPNYYDGKCSYNDRLKKTTIKISTFDITNPYGDSGALYNPDEKVITDNTFKVSIYFPLSYVFEVLISTPKTNNGFTLKELIYSIKNLYEFIYEEELRTASPQIFNLKKFCTTCGNKDLSKFIEKIYTYEPSKLDDCSICCSSYNTITESDLEKNYPIKLKCSHVFHDNCIKTWLEKSGTCPMCRYNIFECKNCDGSGIIYYNFTGVVIPVEERGVNINRNISNGVFGIHTFDFEDLVIEKLFYNKTEKRLYVDISG